MIKTLNRLKVGMCLVAIVLLFGAPSIPVAAQQNASAQTVVAIRCATHSEASPKYDRVVFEMNGQLPSFLVIEYVSQLVADGSGKVIPVKGKNILLLVMSPAHIFDSSGKLTVSPKVTCNLPLVTEVVSGGEFEATVRFGIGISVSQKPEIRVQTLTSPTRIVIDFIRK
jgi:hypothetical protein